MLSRLLRPKADSVPRQTLVVTCVPPVPRPRRDTCARPCEALADPSFPFPPSVSPLKERDRRDRSNDKDLAPMQSRNGDPMSGTKTDHPPLGPSSEGRRAGNSAPARVLAAGLGKSPVFGPGQGV